jgi:hypothetical protein
MTPKKPVVVVIHPVQINSDNGLREAAGSDEVSDLGRRQMTEPQIGRAVHAFRLRRNSTTKATDRELQKYDIFTRYGHCRCNDSRQNLGLI